MAEWPSYDPDAEPEEGAPELDEDYDPDRDLDEEDAEELIGLYVDEATGDTAEFNKERLEFAEEYGFVHDCHCDEDWQSGNLSIVSVCYMGLVADALDTLAIKVKEQKESEREIARLKIQLADAVS